MERTKGFTLIELIVVVIIIGILSSTAVPQYLKATERAKAGKARNALALISRSEKMYRADMDTYVTFLAGGANASLGNFTELNDVDADTDWSYAVGVGTPTAFTITATRKAGANLNETIILDQNGNWTGTFTP